MISVYNRQKDLKICKSSVRALVKATLLYLEIPFQEISVYFVTKEHIANLHHQYFHDPSPTDCISFPLDDTHLGEVFVCPYIAKEYAKKGRLDPYRETMLYIVHSILHLMGWDDLEEKERRAMRKKEKSCMRNLDELRLTLKAS
ncbi:MAG: hypothetical protein ACD_17C00088G0004 [uncultured bacterium]|nr:MAG: hypothetical protein ACD_17C00088G0004 [uncultured bacterium]OGN55365.1 MAG: rRNA maturation RNase YbeY [Chlamydiae bacterium RIFCSPHIGHO2_01_FULL_44_39]OGN57119.1 MAG: rRNA maturation RNase YbeY [Chlamydiae bacterium RIFCSPHIGHO2_02_FULL_45_9]OGN59868.1 MAG: rRNA maturation RNase YbeY [Chlamydiae bacterium RIFCSPHIGHO2_12_FULL_44_59]OGN66075.1 MAG: rRNA maturation RNase YbeY [Chlamydiae bacterium RIFCSPLOWO2_01_FULL_44_52]OGN68611.1 MAG: rRNA maturation RNase YbeY [Chlamydiae bacteriu